jgi:hypothetical protein
MSQEQPVSYLTLRNGTPVETRDGARIGVVAHVLADVDADVFDGLVIDQGSGRHRFADADLVGAMDDRAVRLNLDADAAARLPEPTENPASMSTGPDDTVPDDLGDKLRRAWQMLSGAG